MSNTNKKSGLLKKIGVTVLVVLVIAAVVGLNVYNYITDTGVFARRTVAVSSENYNLTTAQMCYYFNAQYQSFYSMYAQYGLDLSQYIDSTKSLKVQDCMFASDQTWFEYFMSQAVEVAEQQLATCEAAKNAGVKLDDSDYAEIDATMENLKASAKENGYSLKQFVKLNYGSFVTPEDIEDALEIEVLASKYLTKVTNDADVSDETIEATYNENPDNYDTVGMISYEFNYEHIISADEEEAKADSEETSDSDEESEEVSTEVKLAASEEARKYAEKALVEGNTPEGFKAVLKSYYMEALHMTEEEADEELAEESYVSDNVTYSSSDESITWAFSAKAGDIKKFETTESHEHEEGDDHSDLATVYEVILMTRERGRDESISYRDVRHILFSKDTYEDDTKAQEVYDKWVADGATVEDFEELAKEYSEDPGSANEGGLYEGVTEGSMVEEFDAWLFDEAREEGDYALVETEDYGWHIMYYEGGIEGYKGQIKSEIQTEAQNKASEEAVEDYAVKVNNDALDEIPA